MKNFEMIGKTTYEGKTYDMTDNKGLVDAEGFGLINFYGGRVKQLGKTEVEGLYLCIENLQVINLIKFDVVPETKPVVKQEPRPDDVPAEKKVAHVPVPRAKSLPRKK